MFLRILGGAFVPDEALGLVRSGQLLQMRVSGPRISYEIGLRPVLYDLGSHLGRKHASEVRKLIDFLVNGPLFGLLRGHVAVESVELRDLAVALLDAQLLGWRGVVALDATHGRRLVLLHDRCVGGLPRTRHVGLYVRRRRPQKLVLLALLRGFQEIGAILDVRG